jgi:cyanate permease
MVLTSRWPDSTAGDGSAGTLQLAHRVLIFRLWIPVAAAWYRWFRDDPAQHSAVNQAELEHIRSGRLPDSGEHGRVPWKIILRNHSILALCGMYFTQSYGFYFYITWFPTYLRSQGFESTTLSILSGLPLILSCNRRWITTTP